MAKIRDLAGQKFYRLTAQKVVGRSKGGGVIWECLCDCGNFTSVASGDLVSHDTKSCGCWRREYASKSQRSKFWKHGHGGDAEGYNCSDTYQSWSSMRARCNNPKDKKYEYYGGRGITICKRWDEFINFLEDMGERPKGLTLERLDVNGNYEPTNCVWETRKQQLINRRPESEWKSRSGPKPGYKFPQERLKEHSEIIKKSWIGRRANAKARNS